MEMTTPSLLESRRAWVMGFAAVAAMGLVWDLAGRGRLGWRTRAVLAGATRVEVFRLDAEKGPRRPDEKEEGEEQFGGWLVTSQGKDQDRPFAEQLADILFDEATYTNRSVHCFDPGVGYRVWRGDRAVEILICFRCNNFYCGPPTRRAKENARFGGSPRRADLVRLAKEAFPGDKEIQALKGE
jgi:hypothetical protein